MLATKHRFNPPGNTIVEGTRTVGGWGKSEIRSYLKDTIKPLISYNIRNRINSVKKWNSSFNKTGTNTASMVADTLVDDIWIPGYKEIFGNTTNWETSGPTYSKLFNDDTSRIKAINENNTVWWLRSIFDTNYVYLIGLNGNLINTGGPSNSYGIALGFCLGLEPETITDDWSTIIAN